MRNNSQLSLDAKRSPNAFFGSGAATPPMAAIKDSLLESFRAASGQILPIIEGQLSKALIRKLADR